VATFDTHADSYEAQVQSSIAFGGREHEFFTARKVEVLVELLRRWVGTPGSSSVLDVGCGIGLTDALLAPRVGSVFGIEPAVEALCEATARGTGARYAAGDARQLPYADASFDAAVAICVFHHIDPGDRDAVVAELGRVVRPGGVVVIFEHNPFNPATRVAVSRCEFDEGVELLTQGASKRLLGGSGLDPVEARGIIYTTSAARWAASLDRALGPIPFGAQYYVVARRP
jgi:SAM-dependent methyltransferase